jgi:hypothetical protein
MLPAASSRAHVLTASEVADALRVDVTRGLSPAEVERRRARHGWNELPSEPPEPLWKLVLAQFDDKLVKILLAAAVVSFLLALSDTQEADGGGLRAMAEPLVIVLILVLNALVGAVQVWTAGARVAQRGARGGHRGACVAQRRTHAQSTAHAQGAVQRRANAIRVTARATIWTAALPRYHPRYYPCYYPCYYSAAPPRPSAHRRSAPVACAV